MLPEPSEEEDAAYKLALRKANSLAKAGLAGVSASGWASTWCAGIRFTTAAEVVRRVWAEENGTQEDETDEIEALQDAENPGPTGPT